MIDKEVHDAGEAVSGIENGATIMIGGFGPPGQPIALIEALLNRGVSDLVVINNNAGAGGDAISRLFGAGRVRKVICSFPKAIGSTVFDELFLAGKIELELVPQGNLAERIRAAGAGIGGFFTKTGYGTELAADKEVRLIDGEHYVFETPLHADFALIRASRADRWGNLVYRKTARNFGPVMAAAAKVTIAEVDHVVALGELDPEIIVTPGIYVDRFISTGYAPTNPKVTS
ncbi:MULTISPECIES: 3-oxoacid CoA-transferase subunit A [Cryobacterium]|uniref:3-oxoacid CoA-transferase subunit A n=1 Tax=Cryobacterium levicorallinum TaxID=995038 RepID=A0A1I2XXM0_9MICO|nr:MULTISPECIES: 3-oxoacid CoA-transferase subunit A [Cryobacterium]TFB85053.1 3-oxoacid CoA-transferase subunit A [Cryobacterium levicorallinum]TFD22529.1 3-oxoacid CoA-transferase subunit A [Cryobacterium sp. TMS1-13-1]TFD62422.1 3-oxoacid CoA-transferase subunit A [Cryobacterium sp. Hh38]SFH18213.1 3-oxoadipate CoA-transferase, alpha subunit [Cryobacterium levicorallinum]GEP26262.1 3-oxoadipate CoA-transferase subunit A [Cryobacterium levicorallinum]